MCSISRTPIKLWPSASPVNSDGSAQRCASSARDCVAGAFVSLVLDAVRGVSPGALLTAVCLADRANKARGGLAWPSLRDIAERTNRQERQVRCDLRELEMAGWIGRLGEGTGGRGRATTYELNVPAMLHAMPIEKAAPHCRELRKLPGILGPGFTLNNRAKGAVHDTKPGSAKQKPGTPLQETRHHTAPEPEVEPEFITGFEPEARARARANAEPHGTGAAAPLSLPFKKLNTEPEGTVPNASDSGTAQQTPV